MLLMTVTSQRRGAQASASLDSLPEELIDHLADVVTLQTEAHTRSVVIANLMAEIFETIRGLHGADPDEEELASLYRVLGEAYAHRARMATARAAVRKRP